MPLYGYPALNEVRERSKSKECEERGGGGEWSIWKYGVENMVENMRPTPFIGKNLVYLPII